jgi:hypothetical protein
MCLRELDLSFCFRSVKRALQGSGLAIFVVFLSYLSGFTDVTFIQNSATSVSMMSMAAEGTSVAPEELVVRVPHAPAMATEAPLTVTAPFWAKSAPLTLVEATKRE